MLDIKLKSSDASPSRDGRLSRNRPDWLVWGLRRKRGFGNVSERTIRRWAKERGYRVVKSRSRNATPENHGLFMVIDAKTRLPAFGVHYDASAPEVATFLSENCAVVDDVGIANECP